MNLIITDQGDESVGIFSQTFKIETPFSENEDTREDIEWFRDRLIQAYAEFAQGRLLAMYDFEIKEAEAGYEGAVKAVMEIDYND